MPPMKVRPGNAAGRAHRADQLPPADMLPHHHPLGGCHDRSASGPRNIHAAVRSIRVSRIDLLRAENAADLAGCRPQEASPPTLAVQMDPLNGHRLTGSRPPHIWLLALALGEC